MPRETLWLHSAGATFPAPLYGQWLAECHKRHPDGSGTTFAFTNHLSAVSEEWRHRGPGTGRLVDWPAHSVRVPGNDGVATHIKQTPGALGYVEYGLAKRMGLAMAWLENKAGQFIQPHGGSGLASLLQAVLPENLRAFFPDPDGPYSYPIVTYSTRGLLVINHEYTDDGLLHVGGMEPWTAEKVAKLTAMAGVVPATVGENKAQDVAGRARWQMVGILAELERSLIQERTTAGRAAAQARGMQMGRKPRLATPQVTHAHAVFEQRERVAHVAPLLNVSRRTGERALRNS
jgi:hypothetical protein